MMYYAREKRREGEERNGKWPIRRVRNRQGHRGGEDGGERRAEGEAQPTCGRGETQEGSESKVFSDAHALISRCKKFVYT